MPRARLVLLISSMAPGGAQRICATLANHWAGQGWDVTLVTLSEVESDFYLLDSRIRRVGMGRAVDSLNIFVAVYQNVRRVVSLRKELRLAGRAVAISFMDSNNVLLALAGFGCPDAICIGTEHIHPPRIVLGRAWSMLRKLSYRYLWAVVALTRDSASWISRHTFARRVEVIPNAVQWPLPVGNPTVAPPPKRGGRLLGVGRLTSQKGFDVLLRCFAQVAPAFEDWQLVILGEGDQRPVLEGMIHQLELSGRVEMPGNVGNVAEWYSASDIYVMTSLYEGFPMTLIEAMSHGLAVISFDCETGPREIIRDGINGILVEDGDADSMLCQLMELMLDQPRRATMGDRAREVRTRLSVEVVSKQWEAMFEEVFRLKGWTISDPASVDLLGVSKASETFRAPSRSRV